MNKEWVVLVPLYSDDFVYYFAKSGDHFSCTYLWSYTPYTWKLLSAITEAMDFDLRRQVEQGTS